MLEILVRDINQFIESTLKNSCVNNGISICGGKLKNDSSSGMRIAKYIFESPKWDLESATKWANEHIGMMELEMGNNEIINFDDKEYKMEKIKKLYSVESKDFNDEEKSFIATASTDDIDRDGDILATGGWKLKNFKKNPIVLWQHDASLMPIAKAENVWVEENKLKFKPIFAPSDVNPFAEQVYNAYKKGFLTSFSVRFDPIEWEDMPVDKEKPMLRQGRKYKSSELLEISAVNVPANPNATKSTELLDFVVKSYLYENKSNINVDLKEIYTKADNELKEKLDRLFELQEIKQKNLELKKVQEIETFVDNEILKLSAEINNELLMSQEKEKSKILTKELKELQIGITDLLK